MEIFLSNWQSILIINITKLKEQPNGIYNCCLTHTIRTYNDIYILVKLHL